MKKKNRPNQANHGVLLFNCLPAGFFYFPDFIDAENENELLNNILKLDWQEIKMHGKIAKRKVVHFGLDYTYDSRSVKPTTPAPDFLQPLIQRSAQLLKVPVSDLVEILITQYPEGAGIGWHRDAPIFGDQVFGLSLAAPAIMKFRIKHNEKYKVLKTELAQRSAYILSGPARWKWQHSIPAVKSTRYSITFRTLRKNLA